MLIWKENGQKSWSISMIMKIEFEKISKTLKKALHPQGFCGILI